MKITLRIPDDLKARMDAVDDVNWSAVARDAFEMKVLQDNAQKKDANMNDVIERLRATRKQSKEESDKAKGKRLGREWAKKTATLDELDELEALEEVGGREFIEGEQFLRDGAGEIDPSDREAPNSWLDIVFAAVKRRDFDFDTADKAEEWWSDIGGRRNPSVATLQGFIDGALEVLKEVEEHL